MKRDVAESGARFALEFIIVLFGWGRFSMTYSDETAFEDEVRRIARQLWPEAANDGARKISGRERDGVFVTEDVVHIIESTVSRRKDKVQSDAEKTVKAISPILKEFPQKVIKGWIITKEEPTADQRSVCEKHKSKLQIMSFHHFKSKLVDSKTYINLRKNYPFGSIRNTADDTSWNVSRHEFVDLDFTNIDTQETSNFVDVSNNFMLSNKNIVITGDFGAGKSMTLREIFFQMEEKFYKHLVQRFPIYLNLRDHYGQDDPGEALIRHGTKIGFSQPQQLIRAWRAGYTHIILDGFDELAAAGWFSAQKKLRDLRYNAMRLVRRFIFESPDQTAVLLAGRSHYFDGPKEMRRCLAISTNFCCLTLNEFTSEQVASYLEKKGFSGEVPQWLPSRPLLLGYIVGRRIIGDIVVSGKATTPDEGWDDLLELICKREARIEANIDPETLREILERLATKTRKDPGGLGRLADNDIFLTFQEVTGYAPDDMAQMLLMRLPGLGKSSEEDSSRTFVDEDLADAARAGDVVRFIQSPFTFDPQYLCNSYTCIGEVGAAVASLKCRRCSIKPGQLGVALHKSAQEFADGGILAVDIFKIIQQCEVAYDKTTCDIKNCYIQEIAISSAMEDMSLLTFVGCIFQTVYIDFDVKWDKAPRFRDCIFGEIEGRMRREDLPTDVFDSECEFEFFSHYASTTNEILNLDIPEGVKVLLTILKKLFVQKGRARQESALLRGLDHRSRRLVPEVLAAVEQEGLATRLTSTDNILWKPERSETSRAFSMLSLHATAADPLVSKCANID